MQSTYSDDIEPRVVVTRLLLPFLDLGSVVVWDSVRGITFILTSSRTSVSIEIPPSAIEFAVPNKMDIKNTDLISDFKPHLIIRCSPLR